MKLIVVKKGVYFILCLMFLGGCAIRSDIREREVVETPYPSCGLPVADRVSDDEVIIRFFRDLHPRTVVQQTLIEEHWSAASFITHDIIHENDVSFVRYVFYPVGLVFALAGDFFSAGMFCVRSETDMCTGSYRLKDKPAVVDKSKVIKREPDMVVGEATVVNIETGAIVKQEINGTSVSIFGARNNLLIRVDGTGSDMGYRNFPYDRKCTYSHEFSI